MKPGRPKKGGKRFPCGKRTPKAIEDDIMQTAVEARMRVFGIKPGKQYPVFNDKGEMTGTLEGKDLARSNIMGSPLQRLQHYGYITTAQADAGHNFAVTMREYLSSGRLQRPTIGSASLEAKSPSNDSELTTRGETKAKALMESLAEIDRTDPLSSPTATSVVWKVCISEDDIHGEAAIGALRVGLNAIHRILYGRKAA